MNTEHWNAALPTSRRNNPGQWLWLSGLKAFSFWLSLTDCCCSTLSPSAFSCYSTISSLQSRWSTRIGPPQVQKNCRGMTEKPAVSGRQAWGPPGRTVETICTSQWLCLISPAPPVGFVQLPWSFYGPCGHNPPKQSPEGKSFFGRGSDRFSKVRFLDLEVFLGGFVMNDIDLPARLYRAGFPQKAVLAGTAGQVFSLRSWSSF